MGSIRARVAPDERAAVRRVWFAACCLGTLLRCLIQTLAVVMGLLYLFSVVCSEPQASSSDEYFAPVGSMPETVVMAPQPERITREPSYGTL